jgi:hypothetical protein
MLTQLSGRIDRQNRAPAMLPEQTLCIRAMLHGPDPVAALSALPASDLRDFLLIDLGIGATPGEAADEAHRYPPAPGFSALLQTVYGDPEPDTAPERT